MKAIGNGSRVLCGIAFLTLTTVAQAATYYISASTGVDTNNGLTAATAWQSIGKLNSVAFAAGDRVYLKAGDTFTAGGGSSFNIGWSGTATNHVVIGAYHTDTSGNAVTGPGSAARPKIASSHVFTAITSSHTSNTPYTWVPALYVTGDYVELRDLELDNWGEAFKIEGSSNVTVDDVKSSAAYECGMAVDGADTVTISNSEVFGDDQGFGVFADSALRWCGGINVQDTSNITVQRTYVHEGYGEGIIVFTGSKVGEISQNTVYAQRAVGIYAGWAQNLKIHSNLILGTSDSRFFRNGSYTGPGIALSDEDYELTNGSVTAADALSNIAVYDNLVAGTSSGFTIWQTTSTNTTGLTLYNNTFVDNNAQISPASCSSCIAENNIAFSLSTGSVDHAGTTSGGIVFHNNYWSKGNPGTGLADAATDVYSGLTLAKMTGWQSIANASSLPTWQSFVPLSGSSTFQEGTALLAAPYNVDYNGNPHRNPMDLGAIAGTGSVGVAPVAAFSCSPLSGNAPVTVTCTDSSSNRPTSWSWTFGDGGTSTSQNPTHAYSAAGTYNVALTASNSSGSNTATKTSYITVSSSSSGNVTPNPAAPGQTVTISDTFTPTVTDGAAEIVYWVYDASNNLLGRCGSTSTSITSGTPKTLTCTFAIPTTAAAGAYHVGGTVYRSSSDMTSIEAIATFATFTIS